MMGRCIRVTMWVWAVAALACVEGVKKGSRWRASRIPTKVMSAQDRSPDAQNTMGETWKLASRVRRVLGTIRNVRVRTVPLRAMLPSSVREGWLFLVPEEMIYGIEVRTRGVPIHLVVIPVGGRPLFAQAVPVVYFLWVLRVRRDVSPRIVRAKLREFNRAVLDLPVAAELAPESQSIVFFGWHVVQGSSLGKGLARSLDRFLSAAVWSIQEQGMLNFLIPEDRERVHRIHISWEEHR